MRKALSYKQHRKCERRNVDAYADVILDGRVIGMIVGPMIYSEAFIVRLNGAAQIYEAFGRCFDSQEAAKAHVAANIDGIRHVLKGAA